MGTKYRAMIRLWRNAWTEFIPFLDYDIEIRKVICSTNAIVIWSALVRVIHVGHDGARVGNLPRGSGYLPLSMR